MLSSLPTAAESAGPRRSLTVQVHRPGPVGRVDVTVTGDVDSCTAPIVTEALRELLADPAGHVVVDLSGVTFFNAAALSAMAAAASAAAEAGTLLHLDQPSMAVARVLDVRDRRRPATPGVGS